MEVSPDREAAIPSDPVELRDALLREREERRGEVGRLLAELRESRAALTRARRDFEAKASAMARLEQMHDALLGRNQELERSLAQLEERQATLLGDRDFAMDRVMAALTRLRD